MKAKRYENTWYNVYNVYQSTLNDFPVLIMETDDGEMVIQGRLFREIMKQINAGIPLRCIGNKVMFVKRFFKVKDEERFYWDMVIKEVEKSNHPLVVNGQSFDYYDDELPF